MKTIQENVLKAVQLCLSQTDPLLETTLRGIIGNGTFTPPPIGRGQTIFSAFTPGKPIPTDVGLAILENLENFSNSPTGKIAVFEGMNMHGLINNWRNFISK